MQDRERGPSARRAWIAIVLTPLGLVAGVAVAYGMAAVLGVTLDPATGPGPSSSQNAVIYSVASLAWLAPPVAAVVLALAPAKAGSPSGRTALAVGGVLLLAGLALAVWSVLGG